MKSYYTNEDKQRKTNRYNIKKMIEFENGFW